ncbi:hypothetical protein SCG7086_BG_00160 [Chlamydiales bacterium SCGC AG-110-P3]|nr:hypothetical protein SCG7086_BG_00160 [Chlamydiales bacterium SCGC AG-110-P3]
MTNDQRCQLYALKKRGDSPSAIAKQLGFHRSSIYLSHFTLETVYLKEVFMLPAGPSSYM